MKQRSSLWGSISILIGVVIAILALAREPWLTPLLITVFALWGLWVILTQLVPLWRAEAARRRDEKETQRVQEELKAANVPDISARFFKPPPASAVTRREGKIIIAPPAGDHDFSLSLSRPKFALRRGTQVPGRQDPGRAQGRLSECGRRGGPLHLPYPGERVLFVV